MRFRLMELLIVNVHTKGLGRKTHLRNAFNKILKFKLPTRIQQFDSGQLQRSVIFSQTWQCRL